MGSITSISTSQLLASGAVSWTPSRAGLGEGRFCPQYITLHTSGSMASAQTFTVTLDDRTGSTYDTLLYSEAISGGITDKLYTFPEGMRESGVEAGSYIKVTLTNTATPATAAYLKLFYEV